MGTNEQLEHFFEAVAAGSGESVEQLGRELREVANAEERSRGHV